MPNDTDYKRLWRNAQKQVLEYDTLLDKANQRIEALVDVIKRVKSGELKVTDIKEEILK